VIRIEGTAYWVDLADEDRQVPCTLAGRLKKGSRVALANPYERSFEV